MPPSSIERKLKRKIRSGFGWLAGIPFTQRAHRAERPSLVSRTTWADILEREFNHEGRRVLEIGSRVITGINLRSRFSQAEYIGFDIRKDGNVDVVGDVHHLSQYFEGQEKFDLIFSSSVFEHLKMPWIAAEEINKLVKVGGSVFIETHFAFSAHDRPWNFFQFSDMGLRALFNRHLGYEVQDMGLSNPMNGYFSRSADPDLRYVMVKELYCHSYILAKKVQDVEDFDWRKVVMDDVVDPLRYLKPMA